MSSSILDTGSKSVQAVVVIGQVGFGGDADGGLVGRAFGGAGGDRRYENGDILSWWEDNVANVTIGTEPNDTLAYAPGL